MSKHHTLKKTFSMILQDFKTIEELVCDESFLHFYFQKNENDVLDWEDWYEDNTERTALVTEAFAILDRLSLKWDKATVQQRYQKIHEELFPVKAEPRTKARRLLLPSYWHYAVAASLFFAVTTWFLFKKSDKLLNERPSSVYEAQKPKNEALKKALVRFYRLPDGSKVQLKAGSELQLADDFNKTKRLVFLKGEAKFEVAHNATRPFVVKSDNVFTTALGTVFIVKSAVSGKVGQVSLIEGKVKVEYEITAETPQHVPEVILTEGLQVRFELGEKAFSEVEKLPTQIVNWQHLKILSVEKMRLSEVFAKLADSYDVRFEGVDKELSNYIITGMFDTNLPLSNIMEVLAFSNDFEFRIQDKKVIINKI
jgi:transmembrane sensor